MNGKNIQLGKLMRQCIRIVRHNAGYYPTSIFPPPDKDTTTPDRYAAAGCRLIAENIETDLRDYFKELGVR